MKHEQKEIEIHVLDCPLMIEDNAELTWVYLPFCEACEYHEGMKLGMPLCSANQGSVTTPKRENKC